MIKKYFKALLIILSIISTSNQVFAQYYKPSSQTNNDISFDKFICEMKVVEIYFDNNLKFDNVGWNIMQNGMEVLLKKIGFDEIYFQSMNRSDYAKKNSICDIAIVYVNAQYEEKTLSNLELVFSSCDDSRYYFRFANNLDFLDQFERGVAYYWEKQFGEFHRRVFEREGKFSLKQYPTEWDEKKLREYFLTKKSYDLLEGLYEQIKFSDDYLKESKFKLGILKNNDYEYTIIYVEGALNPVDWKEGEEKGKIYRTNTENLYTVYWRMGNKVENKNVLCKIDDNNLLNFDFSTQNNTQVSKFVKLLPISPKKGKNNEEQLGLIKSGTAFAISEKGYLITSQHIIENTDSIIIKVKENNIFNKYKCEVVLQDKTNDLCVLKISDIKFKDFTKIPFVIRKNNADVGERVITLGYPMRDAMGDELKLTDGIISSKTGFQGDVATYQISVPVQPGNSGGPLFDKNGNLLGIICAKLTQGDNVTYAVKANILPNLLSLLPTSIKLNEKNVLNKKELTEQIKILEKFVFIIEAFKKD